MLNNLTDIGNSLDAYNEALVRLSNMVESCIPKKEDITYLRSGLSGQHKRIEGIESREGSAAKLIGELDNKLSRTIRGLQNEVIELRDNLEAVLCRVGVIEKLLSRRSPAKTKNSKCPKKKRR